MGHSGGNETNQKVGLPDIGSSGPGCVDRGHGPCADTPEPGGLRWSNPVGTGQEGAGMWPTWWRNWVSWSIGWRTQVN